MRFLYFRRVKFSFMAKIIAFAGSNSSHSINYQLVRYSCDLIEGHDIQLLNLVNFPFPMFSVDLEKEKGYSNSLIEFRDDIASSQGLILSVNEYNSGPSAYFKNVLDWLSRVDRSFLDQTKVLLMSTSPGKRGGISSLAYSEQQLPRFGAEIVATFSMPSFHTNFAADEGIKDPELKAAHATALEAFLQAL